jgi:hypothetical protein
MHESVLARALKSSGGDEAVLREVRLAADPRADTDKWPENLRIKVRNVLWLKVRV